MCVSMTKDEITTVEELLVLQPNEIEQFVEDTGFSLHDCVSLWKYCYLKSLEQRKLESAVTECCDTIKG